VAEGADVSPEYLLGLLNSSTLEFFLKQTSSPLQNGYYQFLTRYQERLPIKMRKETEQHVINTVRKIREAIDLQNKIESFPERYVRAYDNEVNHISYEWQTRRYPVNAEVQGDVDGDFTVQAGRSDIINDPAMYSDDREMQKRRAEYVHAAVDGRNVKSGEEMTIPIPRSDDGVLELLDSLEADREEVRQTDIEALEAEIDQAVYDLFDLTEDEREVVEDYLEVF